MLSDASVTQARRRLDQGPGGAELSAIYSTAARLLTMLVSLVCGVMAARLVLGQAGTEQYALMTLLIALPSLITFSDLGAGAVVVNGVASSSDVRSDEQLRRQVTTVVRVILMFVGVIAIISTTLLVTGGWHVVLGSASTGPDAGLAAWICVLIYCCTASLGIWQRVLLGLGKNPTIILLQGIISPLSLLFIWFLLTFHEPRLESFLALGTFLATFAVAMLGIVVADRHTAPLLRHVARRVFHPRAFPGVRVMHVGWFMLIQLLATPLSITLPRYILAQSADPVELAQYAMAGQVFFALQGLVAAAGVSLWPAFAKARAAGSRVRGPHLLSLLFGAGLAVATAIVVAIGPMFFAFVSDDTVEVSNAIIVSFGAMIMMLAIVYPLGMFIMDTEGIRFQVGPAVLMTVSTIGLSILVTPELGVIGPLLSNAASVCVFQVIPYLVYIRRHRERLYGGHEEH